MGLNITNPYLNNYVREEVDSKKYRFYKVTVTVVASSLVQKSRDINRSSSFPNIS